MRAAQVCFGNLNGFEVAPRVAVRGGGRRRLDRLVAARTKHLVGKPFLVSVHRQGDILLPTEDSVRLKAVPADAERHEIAEYEARLWSRTYIEPGDTVLITIEPQGGQGNSGAKIGMTVAMIALLAFAAWAGPAAAAAMLPGAANATAAGIAGKVITAGIMVGGGALIASFNRQGNKDNKLYGVSGGGNMPRPNDTIPVGYGRFWHKPDLSQRDYFYYEGDSMVLLKRMTLAVGKYEVTEIRIGDTTMWTGGGGAGLPNAGVKTNVTSPFTGTEFEVIMGQASTLVPGDVLTSANVTANTLPLQNDPNPIAGPFRVTAPGIEIDRIQFDYSWRGYFKHNTGTSLPIDLWFEYAECDTAGNIIGPWQTAYRETNGGLKVMQPKRFTRYVDVPPGQYMVRARNNVFRFSPDQEANFTRDISWEAARGHTPDTRVRTGITELCIRARAGKEMTSPAFSEVWVKLKRLGPVWDGTQFVEAEIRKCVDCYADALTDADYGGGQNLNFVDLAKVRAYHTGLTEFDTYDGLIRGPDTLLGATRQILVNMRAEPILIGAGWSFTRDEPKVLRRHTFSRRQIVRGSTAMDLDVEADDGTCHVQIDFFDDTDPKRPNNVEGYDGVPSVLGPRRIEWPGIGSYAHAEHLRRWLTKTGFYRRSKVKFDTELAGRLVLRGDPIAVDPWFVTTRAVAGVLERNDNRLILDSDVELGADFYAMLRDREGVEFGPIKVTQGDSPRAVVLDAVELAAEETAANLTLTQVLAKPTSNPTTIIIGPLGEHSEQWLVKVMEPKEGQKTSVVALLDNPLVYDGIGEPIPPDSPITWEFKVKEAPDIRQLSAKVVNHTSSLVLQWSLLADAGATRFRVFISQDGADWTEVYDGASASGEVAVRYSDAPIYVKAQAIGRTGIPGAESAPFAVSCPKPVVSAEVPYTVLQSQTKAIFEKLAASEQEIRVALDQVGGAIASMQAILRNADMDQVQKAERIQAVAANALSQVTAFSTVQAAMGRAFAAFGVDVTAAVNQNNAGSFLRLISEADESGALAVLRLAVSASLGGPATEAAIELSTDGVRTLIAFIAEFVTIRSRAGQTMVEWDTETGGMNLYNMALYAALIRDKQGPDWRMELTGKHLRFRDSNKTERIFMGFR